VTRLADDGFLHFTDNNAVIWLGEVAMKALAKRYYTQSAYSRINISYKVPSDT